MIRYKCKKCGEKLESDDSFAGLTDDCPVCGYKNFVPKTRKQLKEDKCKQRENELAELEKQAIALKDEEKHEATRSPEEKKCSALKKEYEAALISVKKESHITKMWYCIVEGKEWGPMPESQLQAWISENRVKSTDEIRPENINIWLSLFDLPEIFTFSVDITHISAPSHINRNTPAVDTDTPLIYLAFISLFLFCPILLLRGCIVVNHPILSQNDKKIIENWDREWDRTCQTKASVKEAYEETRDPICIYAVQYLDKQLTEQHNHKPTNLGTPRTTEAIITFALALCCIVAFYLVLFRVLP